MEFISKTDLQFKANLHSHTTLSDGKLTPEQCVEAYKSHGYHILAITDHEAPYSHQHYTTHNFLMLTGYEAYLRPSAECKLDWFGPEIHLNLFAKEPNNLTYIGYDPAFCKYLPKEYAAPLPKATNQGIRQYNVPYIQSFINSAIENGYLVSLNHPCWAMESQEILLALDGCFSLEVFNTGSVKISGFEDNMAFYDALLRSGKFWYLHGADDNHNVVPLDDYMSDSFGSWTMIIAPELTYQSVISALEHGNFYASTGPQIYELQIHNNKAKITCSDAVRITMHMSLKYCQNVWNHDGTELHSAEFFIPEDAPYVYFSVFEKNGGRAHTRAFLREEFSK